MDETTKHELEALPIPELWRRYEEAVGFPSRNPNRHYLVRKIVEALGAQPAPVTDAPVTPAEEPAESVAPEAGHATAGDDVPSVVPMDAPSMSDEPAEPVAVVPVEPAIDASPVIPEPEQPVAPDAVLVVADSTTEPAASEPPQAGEPEPSMTPPEPAGDAAPEPEPEPSTVDGADEGADGEQEADARATDASLQAGERPKRKRTRNYVVLPFWAPPKLAVKLDKAVSRLGYASRMELFRLALGNLLAKRGEKALADEVMSFGRGVGSASKGRR